MRVRRLLLALAGTALALTACGGDPVAAGPDNEPDQTPTTPTASPTATATPTAVATPKAERETPEQFIRRWQAASDRMQRTGKVEAVLEMSPGCSGCSSFAQSIQEIYEAGGHVEYGGTRIARVQRDGSEGGSPVWSAEVVLAETRVWRSKDSKPEVLPGGKETFRYTLDRSDSGWAMRALGFVAR